MINNGPELWSKLLEEAPEGSVLMGGAVVDWAFGAGLKPKDFDLWIPYIPGYIPKVDGWHRLVHHTDMEQYAADPGQPVSIGSVNTYLRDGPNHSVLKIQVIGVLGDDPKSQFSKFDHSLTLGSFSENGLFVHKMVYDSINTKTVTCINNSKPVVSLERAMGKVIRYCPATWTEWIFTGFE